MRSRNEKAKILCLLIWLYVYANTHTYIYMYIQYYCKKNLKISSTICYCIKNLALPTSIHDHNSHIYSEFHQNHIVYTVSDSDHAEVETTKIAANLFNSQVVVEPHDKVERRENEAKEIKSKQ